MDNGNGKQKYKRSKQRECILKHVLESHGHPTADEIYKALKPEFPKLSLGTVYRNLRILEDQDLIREVKAGGNFGRFEARKDNHPHFVCRDCGAIYDIDLDIDNGLRNRVETLLDVDIEGMSLEFHGTCRNGNCRPLEKSSEQVSADNVGVARQT